MRSIYGLVAALIAAFFPYAVAEPDYRPRKPKRKFALPDQTGPITDSTRESKRARRRRLAREKQS
jgi:hypothetical protein